MREIQKLWLALTVVGPLHMGEQLITSIEEYHMIKGSVVAGYYSLFSPADTDWATVVLITIVWTSISLLFYALLRGGRALLAVTGAFGVMGAMEAHHVLEALAEGGYDPGVVTSFAYAWVGVLMTRAVWREYRSTGRGRHAASEGRGLLLGSNG
jgi:hypothetical protein